MPASASGRDTANRVTGTEAPRGRGRCAPAALIPAIIARLSMRAERLESWT